MGALVSEKAAKENLEELKKAFEINPSMFREDKIKTFYEDLYGTGDQHIDNVFAAFDHVYATEIRFTDKEYQGILDVIKEHGFKVIEESKKEAKEEAMKRLGDNYNPIRDDYAVIAKYGKKQFYFHFVKKCVSPGRFVENAKTNKLEVDYVINRFCVNAEDTKHWFTTPQTQFVMEEYKQKPFKKMLKILAAGLELKQYKQDNSDDYYSRFHELKRFEGRSTRSATLAKRVKIVQKYEESKKKKK